MALNLGRRSPAPRCPIKLDLTAYNLSPVGLPIWRDAPKDMTAQGAYLRAKAFAVVQDAIPSLAPR